VESGLGFHHSGPECPCASMHRNRDETCTGKTQENQVEVHTLCMDTRARAKLQYKIQFMQLCQGLSVRGGGAEGSSLDYQTKAGEQPVWRS